MKGNVKLENGTFDLNCDDENQLNNNQIVKVKFQSDIMIVKCSENDYFVSEKIHNRGVYLKLLNQRSSVSKHYRSLEDAHVAAELLKNKIRYSSPDCEIIEYDIDNIPSNDKYDDFDEIFKYLCDDNGRKIIGITNSGKKIIVSRENDEKYKYINVENYQNILGRNIITCEENEFSFYNIGKAQGYEFAKNTSLQYLYFEIYKTSEYIKILQQNDRKQQELLKFNDDGMYCCEIEMYKGYKNALEECIEIQKSCVLQEQNWRIHVVNLSDIAIDINIDSKGFIDGLGSYSIIMYDSIKHFVPKKNFTDYYLICVNGQEKKKISITEIGLAYDNNYTILTANKHGKFNFVRIEKLLSKLCCLSKGNCAIEIQDDWIPQLVNCINEE